jgi:hypothetical protein
MKSPKTKIEADAQILLAGVFMAEDEDDKSVQSFGIICHVLNSSGDLTEVVVECDKQHYLAAQGLLQFMQTNVTELGVAIPESGMLH